MIEDRQLRLEGNQKNKVEILMLAVAIASLALTEYFFVFMNPVHGIFSALISVTALYLALSFIRCVGWAVRGSIEAICLLQIYVLLISSLPWFFVNQELLIPAAYSILLALCLWHIKDAKIALEEIGFKRAKLKYVLVAVIAAVPLGAIEYQILRPSPPTPSFSLAYFLQTTLYMLIFVGFGEELLFRGILMTSLEKHMNTKPALILQSLIFTILHLTWRSIAEIIFVFIAGIIFGLLLKRSGSLIPPAVAHGIGNIMLLSIFPFLGL